MNIFIDALPTSPERRMIADLCLLTEPRGYPKSDVGYPALYGR